jgi:hypothetical protein
MSTYPVYRPRGGMNRLLSSSDDFMNWLLYGHETWLVATLKGVSLFLFMYFAVFYVPNYVYYLITVEIPFLRFSEDVGFLVANGVGMGTFALVVVIVVLVQAARGRQGFGWSAIRIFVLLNFLLTVLLIIPIMAFNLAGGSFWPVRFPLAAVGFGVLVAGLGAASLVYLVIEYRRITGRETALAERRSAQLAQR